MGWGKLDSKIQSTHDSSLLKNSTFKSVWSTLFFMITICKKYQTLAQLKKKNMETIRCVEKLLTQCLTTREM